MADKLLTSLFSGFQSITEKEKLSEVRVTEVSLAAVGRELFTNGTRKSQDLESQYQWLMGSRCKSAAFTLQKTYRGMESFESEGHEEVGE